MVLLLPRLIMLDVVSVEVRPVNVLYIVGMKVSEMTREVVTEPEGASVEIITVAPDGSPVLVELDADADASLEAGDFGMIAVLEDIDADT